MSKRDKLIVKLVSRCKTFTWDEAVTLMGKCDFKLISKGGSRRKFFHNETEYLVSIHQPHPQNTLKQYQIQDLIEALKVTGWIVDDE